MGVKLGLSHKEKDTDCVSKQGDEENIGL